jgi:2-polyprenyl-3-methyl-5-hydroxy-6-metoxy-1,4-benzoquinol methylase
VEQQNDPGGRKGVALGRDFNEQRYGGVNPSGGEATDDRVNLMMRLVEKIHRAGAKSILDVGCTDGFLSRKFKHMGLYTIGIDASASAVESARAHTDEAYVADTGKEPLPIPNDKVELIWAGEIIEHIFDTEFFIEELLRVAKPGGRLVLSTPNLGAWINRVALLLGTQPFFTETGVRPSNHGSFLRKVSTPAGHIRNFTQSSLKHLLERCGWTVESMHGAALLSGKSVLWMDKLISHSMPSLATDLVFVCRK